MIAGRVQKPDIRLVTAIAAKTGSTVAARVDGKDVTIQCARDLTVAANDILVVLRFGSQWFAAGRYFLAAAADTPDNDPPPDPKPAIVTGRLVISPVETRSYRSGGWRTDTTDVYQGQYGGGGNHIGCAFYGNKGRSLEGATVTRASIRVRRPDRGGSNAPQGTTLRLVEQATRPGGSPTLGASATGPELRRGETENTFVIPDSWGQAIVDGTSGGIGVYEADGSPYVILSGRGDWGPAFTLTVDWSRTT